MALVQSIAKFLIAGVGIAVTLGLFDPGTAQTVSGIITAILVFAVKNTPQPV